jgi:GNAT superfamily N-acetyltransferase
MSTATYRHATKEDIPSILAMIRELAAYEHAEDEVKATEESLEQTLSFAPFSNAPSPGTGVARTILVEAPEGGIAGMALYFYNYSTWRGAPGVFLEDLFVRPQYRKRGYGKSLIIELAKEVNRIRGGRLTWNCLRWNEPSLKFYDSLGAKRMEEWVELRVDGEALEKLSQAGSQN